MNYKDEITVALKALKKHDVECSPEFVNDLHELVTTNINKFIKSFYSSFLRRNFEQYNKYEKLGLTTKQRNELNGNKLYRYEYRKDSNFRCIYTIVNANNIEKVILLCAFNEDGDKTKGRKSYKDNIERAIRIYLNIFK